MAQSTLHFSLGMLLATAWHIPFLLARWRQRQPLAQSMGRWIASSYLLGLYATIPAIVRRICDTDLSHVGWHIFLLYPLVDNLPLPSILLGELLVAAMVALQYGSMLWLVYQYRRHFDRPAPEAVQSLQENFG